MTQAFFISLLARKEIVIQDTKTRLHKPLSTCQWYGIAHVVVIFLSQVIFVFLLFLGMLINAKGALSPLVYANKVETKEK